MEGQKKSITNIKSENGETKKIKNSYVKYGRSDYLEVFAVNKKSNRVESYELRGQSAPIQDS